MSSVAEKLNALKSKDVDKIVADKVYIPSLGKDYTKLQLTEWLQKRILFLETMEKLSQKEIEYKYSDITSSLDINLSTKVNDSLDMYPSPLTEQEDESLLDVKLYDFYVRETYGYSIR
jgi:hypothetical protein